MAANPAGTFLFVAVQGSTAVAPGAIAVYSISGTSLSSVGSFATGVNPAGVAVSPSGNFLYVSNQSDNTVSVFTIDAAGNLTQLGTPSTAGAAPSGVALTVKGDFLYVANSGSNNISAFAVCTAPSSICGQTSDGSLVPVTNSPFTAGVDPVAIAVHPLLNFLYVVDRQSNQVSGYTISTGTGELTPTNPATVSTASTPASLAIQPAGALLYVANLGSANVSGFTVGQNVGILRPLTPVGTGGQPAAVLAK
jgi:6-phosphogluconolactonase (cycloisomerase 2 family)